MNFVWVALGGAFGSVGRYWLSLSLARLAGGTFPWGTLLVNIIGCAFIGWFAAAYGPQSRAALSPSVRLLVMTGICGGFTTFSSFTLEALNLARSGEWPKACAYVAASMIACLLGVFLGYLAGAGRS
ncbi:MAG TPA: fluoride efflux transporter CrcB [Bryobacteraceae bacterium]|nr:fluoride efflux transporter CrcB [Bryobacteraceae bacterium]